MESNLSEIDKEFIQNRYQENIDIEENENEDEYIFYNKDYFKLDNIINILQSNNILQNNIYCSVCGNLMHLEENSSYIDKKIWRCRSKTLPSHDIKINIRKNSIFENLKISLQVIYFLSFVCFTENYSIEKSFNECNNNSKILGNNTVGKDSISKLYQILRNSIRKNMHKNWRKEPLGTNIGENGYGIVEIDESSIIGNIHKNYWMFGIIDRFSKDCRVYCVLNDRSKLNLLPIIKRIYILNHLMKKMKMI